MSQDIETRLSKLEQQLTDLLIDHKLFVQRQEDEHTNIHEKIECISKTVNTLELEEKENDLFHNRIMTIWKVLGIIGTILGTVVGGLYILGKDIGILHH